MHLMDNQETPKSAPLKKPRSKEPKKLLPSEEAIELTPKKKYSPQARVRPSIGKQRIGGPKERVTPKFNSVSTTIH